MDWWALSNASLIVWIHLAVHEILADEAFTATDGLISQSFVVAFVHPTYVQIALIWGFQAQLSMWKSVHWLWRYKLNEVCDIITPTGSRLLDILQTAMIFQELSPMSTFVSIFFFAETFLIIAILISFLLLTITFVTIFWTFIPIHPSQL